MGHPCGTTTKEIREMIVLKIKLLLTPFVHVTIK
jgi:hypothetical protein